MKIIVTENSQEQKMNNMSGGCSIYSLKANLSPKKTKQPCSTWNLEPWHGRAQVGMNRAKS